MATENASATIEEVISIMEQRFAELDAAALAPYEAEADKDLRRYQEQCETNKAEKDRLNELARQGKLKAAADAKAVKEQKEKVKAAKKAKKAKADEAKEAEPQPEQMDEEATAEA